MKFPAYRRARGNRFVFPFVAIFLQILTVLADELPRGFAKGSIMVDEAKANLKFAIAFIDQTDERKPMVLILSDEKVALGTWKTFTDIGTEKIEWNGAALLIGREGKLYNSNAFLEGNISAVSGYWSVTLDHPGSDDITGKVESSDPDSKKYQFDATFHVSLK